MKTQQQPAVRLERLLDASPAQVFDAWLDPVTLGRFMTPMGVLSARISLDARVGGAFSIDMTTADEVIHHTGRYVAIERVTRLVFTWRSVHTDDRDTQVTITLSPEGSKTRLRLVHEGLPDEEARAGHEGGWGSALDLQAEYLAALRAPGDLRLVVPLDAPPSRVVEALTTQAGLAGWWTPDCDAEPRVGGAVEVRFPGADFFARFRVTALTPTLVEWECLDGRHPEATGWKELRGWVGTRVRFELAPATGDEGEEATTLTFTHVGLRPELECNAVCRAGWWQFVRQSLRAYVATGAGLAWSPGACTAARG